MNWLKRLHCFSVHYALYPLLLSSLLACGLLAGRLYVTRHWTYIFMAWNLFLAWIPYGISLTLASLGHNRPRRWLPLVALGLVWLAFLPNAPYLVTDLMHLQPRDPMPFWYDLGLFAVFAWTGLFLTVFSLRAMQRLVAARAGLILSWLFVAGVLGLNSLGVYIGRFLRWNSWDLLFHPHTILAEMAGRLANPLEYPGSIGFTLMFAAFLLICYLTITATGLREPA
ncbi:MAG: DUF1361 domain-containing protein [Anaerolineae bacterium]